MLLDSKKIVEKNIKSLKKIAKSNNFKKINTIEFKKILRQTITLSLLGYSKVLKANIITSQLIAFPSKLQEFLSLKNFKEIQNFLKEF